MLSKDELESMAGSANFSQFDGESGQFLSYTGEGDQHLNFDGAGNANLLAAETDRSYKITLTNASTSDVEVILFPRLNRTIGAGGVMTDGTFKATDGTTDITASARRSTISELLTFIRQNPIVLKGMKIKSTNVLQVDGSMKITKWDPLGGNTVSEYIDFDDFESADQFNNKIVEIPLNRQLDGDHDWTISIPAKETSANTKTTITFFFGAYFSNATALKNKRQEAHNTLLRAGGSAAVTKQLVMANPGLRNRALKGAK